MVAADDDRLPTPENFCWGDVGTYDFGEDKRAIIQRFKARAHALIHYNLPTQYPDDCPYCTKGMI